ncbi:hypothetical protein [Chitinophaga defluvii]|uniref:Uncharacterized protein n=1 Tax=Chitinophaga defluvii TaxID=3163343 RepID=A0ABV2TF34_9BACT
MQSELSAIRMKDDSIFFVDFLKRQLRDDLDERNVIPLTFEMYNGSHYEFQYDPVLRKALPANARLGKRANNYLVKVESLTEMCPIDMAWLYGVYVQDIEGKNDRQFFEGLPELRKKQAEQGKPQLRSQVLEDRLRGILPVIKIGVDKFKVNIKAHMLDCITKPDADIYFGQLNLQQDHQECFYGYWNLSERRFERYQTISNTNEVALLVIPREEDLDPVGVARERGFADTDLLWCHPLQMQMEAKLEPLSENAKELLQGLLKEAAEQDKKVKTAHRKGLRLN